MEALGSMDRHIILRFSTAYVFMDHTIGATVGSVDLACLVHLVDLVQPNKRDKPNNGFLVLADIFSILL